MINWIKRHKVLLIVFCIVFMLCVIVSISYLYGGLGTIGKGIETANNAIQKPISSATSGAEQGIKGIFKFRSISKENEVLREENEKLKNEIIRLQMKEHELQELRELSAAMNYIETDYERENIVARVVAMDGSNYFNFFTIDKGIESGVEVDDIIITGKGLVGRVIEAGHGFAKVVAIVDEYSKVSFQILRDMSVMGIVSGSGNGTLEGYTFDSDASIIEGDILITSGIGIFPEGIPIGEVTSINYNEDTQLKNIEVETLVSFNSLKKVMVLL